MNGGDKTMDGVATDLVNQQKNLAAPKSFPERPISLDCQGAVAVGAQSSTLRSVCFHDFEDAFSSKTMVQLLLFSDVHADLDACRRLVDMAPEADVVIGAGDFCRMRRNLRSPICELSAINTPTVLVPGNAESAEELREACADWDSARVLHGDGCRVEGLSFYGLGGGVPVTPFGPWSYDLTEGEAADLLADCPEEAVLVSHSPPKGVVDRDSRGQSLGSAAVREVIEERTPLLTVCGHIHGSWGEEGTVASTPVFNVGPDGHYREVGA